MRKERGCSIFFGLLCIPKGLSVNLIIDIGNTYAKLALFEGDQLLELRKEGTSLTKALQDIIQKHTIEKSIIASVVDLPTGIIQTLPNQDAYTHRLFHPFYTRK